MFSGFMIIYYLDLRESLSLPLSQVSFIILAYRESKGVYELYMIMDGGHKN
jgi:hypothetical protein